MLNLIHGDLVVEHIGNPLESICRCASLSLEDV